MTSVYISADEQRALFRRLRAASPLNARCFDCSSTEFEWCSVTFAITLCLQCSGKHRAMGAHVSFVRSSSLDKWTREQAARMAVGGNARAFVALRDAPQGADRYAGSAAAALRAAIDRDAADFIRTSRPTDAVQCGPTPTPTPAPASAPSPSPAPAAFFDKFEAASSPVQTPAPLQQQQQQQQPPPTPGEQQRSNPLPC